MTGRWLWAGLALSGALALGLFLWWQRPVPVAPASAPVAALPQVSAPAVASTTPVSGSQAVAPATDSDNAAAAPDPRALQQRTSEGLHEQTLSDGSTMVDLQGHYRSVPTAHLDDRGHVVVEE